MQLIFTSPTIPTEFCDLFIHLVFSKMLFQLNLPIACAKIHL